MECKKVCLQLFPEISKECWDQFSTCPQSNVEIPAEENFIRKSEIAALFAVKINGRKIDDDMSNSIQH